MFIDLPTLQLPQPQRLAASVSVRAAASLDAIFAIVSTNATASAFAALPERELWRVLHERGPARAGTVRTATLANAKQTICVVGYLTPEASAYEQLALAGRMVKSVVDRGLAQVAIAAPGLAAGEPAAIDALLSALYSQTFALATFQSRKPKADRPALQRVLVLGSNAPDFAPILAAARASNLARWLTALPPNVLTAENYRKLIAALAKVHGLKFRWLDESALKRENAGAFLAVAAGNAERSAGIAHLSYQPGRTQKAPAAPAVALVGKGVLFDTGGTNLKPHKSMLEMHMDMAGSAVALATLVAIAELRAPFAADAWLAITENSTGSRAYKPQDIVRASNGVTIQVIHTDAEGRMILADTLALASRTAPRAIIDYATLTGACVYALTERMSGVFTNTPSLIPTLLNAGTHSGERVWNFPFEADYDADLESKVADILQCPVDGKGDHILAARFLSRFVGKSIAWIHMDLSSAIRTGGLAHVTTDATGFGVRYTLELLLREQLLDALPASRPR